MGEKNIQSHLESCTPRLIAGERIEEIVEEPMESLDYTAAVTEPQHVSGEAGG